MKTASKPQKLTLTAPPSIAKQADAVSAELQSLLVDLIDLTLQGKQAHWAVVGPNFLPVHEQLDRLVDAYRAWADEVAERMTAVGVVPDGRSTTVAESSHLEPMVLAPMKVDHVLGAMVERLDGVIKRARTIVDRLDERDLVSQDLVIGIVQGLEKQRWMLDAQRR